MALTCCRPMRTLAGGALARHLRASKKYPAHEACMSQCVRLHGCLLQGCVCLLRIALCVQEVFSLPETPRVAGGRVPVALELLSPSQQPLQITSDLASFWASSYESVKKEGKGRYPKHFWPDNPLEAEATRMTKKAFARAAEREAAQGEGGAKGSGKEAQQQQGAVKAPQKGKKR